MSEKIKPLDKKIPRFCKITENNKKWGEWFILESDYLKALELQKSSIQNFLEEFFVKMNYEKDFCDKAGVLPSIHPRRAKEIMIKSALKHLGKGFLKWKK